MSGRGETRSEVICKLSVLRLLEGRGIRRVLGLRPDRRARTGGHHEINTNIFATTTELVNIKVSSPGTVRTEMLHPDAAPPCRQGTTWGYCVLVVAPSLEVPLR